MHVGRKKQKINAEMQMQENISSVKALHDYNTAGPSRTKRCK